MITEKRWQKHITEEEIYYGVFYKAKAADSVTDWKRFGDWNADIKDAITNTGNLCKDKRIVSVKIVRRRVTLMDMVVCDNGK